MILNIAQFIGKRSKCAKFVVGNPCMDRVSTRLDSKECRCITYCEGWQQHSLAKNAQKKAHAEVKSRNVALCKHLVDARLVLMIAMISQWTFLSARKALRQKHLGMEQLLRLSVNCEQLIQQLEQWVDHDAVL